MLHIDVKQTCHLCKVCQGSPACLFFFLKPVWTCSWMLTHRQTLASIQLRLVVFKNYHLVQCQELVCCVWWSDSSSAPLSPTPNTPYSVRFVRGLESLLPNSAPLAADGGARRKLLAPRCLCCITLEDEEHFHLVGCYSSIFQETPTSNKECCWF